MSTRTEQLRNRLAEIATETQAIEAGSRGRDLSAQELAQIGLLSNEFTQTEARIQLADADERASAPQPSKTAPAPVNGYGQASYTPPPARGVTTIANGPSNATNGFRSLAGWLGAVRNAASGQIDGRLVQNAVTTYGGEGGPGGETGGFAVPPQFAASITELVLSESTVVGALNPLPCDTNMLVLPVDESTPHGTTGIQAGWYGEGAAITPSAPNLKQVTVNLFKASAFVHLSDELLEDSPAIGAHVARVMAAKANALLEEAVVAGNGQAKPLGFLSAPSLVTQAKSATGSTAITATDLGNMVGRLIPGAFASAFWVVHSSVLAKLWGITVGQMPVVTQDYTKSPYGTLLGRPIYVSEFAKDYNTVGDIMLVSPAGYALAVKAGGARFASSIHFAFDQGLQSFRLTMRVGGTPMLSAPTTRKNGSDTQSHLIALAVRS